MADRLYDRPSAHMRVVGVTGTNGKTSTVQLLAQAWQLRGVRSATIGTLGAGLHGQESATGFTTPLVLQLHALLAELRDAGARAVAMEVSSHALDQGRVDGVHFDVAVFTNLSRDHLDYHGDMEAYGAPRRGCSTGPACARRWSTSTTPSAVACLRDLPEGVHALGLSSRGADGASLRAERITLDGDGIGFDLVAGGSATRCAQPLLGRFNVDNLLAVAGALHALGDAPDAIADVLGRLQPIRGRMNRLGGDGRPLVVVDYAHTPDALEQALATLRAHAAGRLVCVFGCGGERDIGKRPQMAAIAEAGADAVIVTDDNPRGEDGDAIVAGILAGFARPDAVTVQRDRRAAIARAVGEAGPSDIVLVAGKGHEPYQEIAACAIRSTTRRWRARRWRHCDEADVALAPGRCRRRSPGRRRPRAGRADRRGLHRHPRHGCGRRPRGAVRRPARRALRRPRPCRCGVRAGGARALLVSRELDVSLPQVVVADTQRALAALAASLQRAQRPRADHRHHRQQRQDHGQGPGAVDPLAVRQGLRQPRQPQQRDRPAAGGDRRARGRRLRDLRDGRRQARRHRLPHHRRAAGRVGWSTTSHPRTWSGWTACSGSPTPRPRSTTRCRPTAAR
jgi:UDP-N-acetylmuramoyl-L-alanyl-D-glutamate--2,6-diaminopimelate ligase